MSGSIDIQQPLPPALPRVIAENRLSYLLTASTFGLSQLNRQFGSAVVERRMGPVLPGAPPIDLIVFVMTVVYGEPFDLRIGLESLVRCSFAWTGAWTGAWSGEANALNTAVLTSVTSFGSEPIRVQSLLGNAYANVVPGPGTALLLMGGLSVLAIRRVDDR